MPAPLAAIYIVRIEHRRDALETLEVRDLTFPRGGQTHLFRRDLRKRVRNCGRRNEESCYIAEMRMRRICNPSLEANVLDM